MRENTRSNKRQPCWDYIQKLNGRTFTRREIERATEYNSRSCKYYLEQLVQAGVLAETPAIGAGNETRYHCVKNLGPIAPSIKDGQVLDPVKWQQNVWNALRALKGGTVEDIVIASRTETEQPSVYRVKTYLQMLVKGGYLRRRKNSYQSIPACMTGPKAPQVIQVNQVFDANTGELVAQTGPESFGRGTAT
jgi:hypothetical protein